MREQIDEMMDFLGSYERGLVETAWECLQKIDVDCSAEEIEFEVKAVLSLLCLEAECWHEKKLELVQEEIERRLNEIIEK